MKKLTLKISTLLSIAALLIVTGCGVKTQVVSTETLLQEMLDKRDVTYFPEHYYTTKQFSSYDRASDKGDPNHHTWFANNDRSQFLRQDTIDGRVESVMFDSEGPGSITRWWITVAGAGAKEGTIRVYIDGSDKPVMEGEALEFIGYNKGVGYPLSSALSEGANELNRGHNLYMPIPYSKHCKVTYECVFTQGPNITQQFYYNINYRTYEANTIVESFTANTLDSLKTLIAETNEALLVPDSFTKSNETTTENLNVSLKPNQTESIIIDEKNTALSEITIKLKAEDMEQALRSTVLKISFDGNQTVWCPVGDFFATGHAWRNSKTWRTEVDEKTSTLSSTWVMPFKKGAEVTVENLGGQKVDVDVQLSQCDYDWNKRSMYFGSSWLQHTNISTGKNNKQMDGTGDTMMDINFVTLKGKGVFVGDALAIYNTALPAWHAWWGEGDEKIYVDGETFPSHFGTGTEDYYGYAWCRPEEFIHPFVSQPIGEGNLSSGPTVNSRFRGLDVIPFKSSFRFDMELWHWSGVTVNYAPTTFYYMTPDGVADMEIDVDGAKAKVARSRFDILSNEVDQSGVLSGFNLKFDDSLLAQINVDHNRLWTWNQAKQGAEFDLEFSVPEEGEYDVIVGVIKNENFATVGFSVNDKSAASAVRCDAKGFAVEEVKLGRHALKLKDNKISVKVIQEKNAHFGIDYVKVVK